MPLLRALNGWMIWPEAGQAQVITDASAARGGVATGAGAGAGGWGAAGSAGLDTADWDEAGSVAAPSAGAGLAAGTGTACAPVPKAACPPGGGVRRNTWPTRSWLGSGRLFQRASAAMSVPVARAIW